MLKDDPGRMPAPGSPEELAAFARLQAGLAPMFGSLFADDRAPRCVVVVPSLSLDQEVMARITGVPHYEERMLCMLLLLRLPRTRVVYVTSTPIAEAIVDYYLHLLPGVPARHARERLHLLACHDGSSRPLSEKILERPRLMQRLAEAIGERETAHMTCFNVSALERTLAVRLGVPIYGCDPALLDLGSKSGSRAVFREAGVPLPAGFENLTGADEVIEALAELKGENPDLARAVVKLNEGFSGEGNGTFDFAGAPEGKELKRWIEEKLPALDFAAEEMSWETYRPKIEEMGAIVEALVEGDDARSPSAQYRIDPLGRLEVISTHDQVLGGRGQIFLGCRFPADEAYRMEIQELGLRVAEVLKQKGVLGRFGVDFVSCRHGKGWRHYAIEVNLRKGGTTHPFLMLQFLTDGAYDPDSGLFHAPGGRPCFYRATDNLEAEHYKGLTPGDLIDIAVLNGLHFHGATQQGVVFHLIGALSEFGKLGMLAVADTENGATRLYEETVTVLDAEGRRARPP